MKLTVSRLLFCTFVAISLSLSSWAQTQAGQIKTAKVEKDVYKISTSGDSVKLKNGDMLTESDTVTTGTDSSVVLVFMNGASVKLAANSRLSISEFKMDPLAETVNVSKLKNEPTVSKTTLALAYGEMIGNVKKLNTSSSYTVRTAVGAAGIRGTTFKIVFRPTEDGKGFTFTLTTAEGLVIFTGFVAGANNVDVSQGQEITVTATADPNTHQLINVTIPTQTTPVSDAAQTLILNAISQANQAIEFVGGNAISILDPQVVSPSG